MLNGFAVESTNHHLRIAVALALCSPLHTGTEVVELVRIETLFIAHADAAHRLLPRGPGRGERVGTEATLMIARPAALTGVLGVVQSVGHHVEEARCVALYAPFIRGIFLAQRALALNHVLMLLPVALAQFALLLPRALIPYKLQDVLKILSQPHVRAIGTVHPHAILHILVGDGKKTELADEVSYFVICTGLLHAPDGLRQRVGPTPCRHVDRPRDVLISQQDKLLAAWRVVALANGLDTTMNATHQGATLDIVGAGPVAHGLISHLRIYKKALLPRAFHQVGHILSIGLDDTLQILGPLLRIGVAVPPHARDDSLYLETVGIRHQPHHRLHVVRLHVSWRYVRTHHQSWLQLFLRCPRRQRHQ